MNKVNTPTWTLGRVCATLLATAALALSVPTAGAFPVGYSEIHGSDHVAVGNWASGEPHRNLSLDAASTDVYQSVGIRVGADAPTRQVFFLVATAYCNRSAGLASAVGNVSVNDEFVLPWDDSAEFTLDDRLRYSHSAGTAAVAVGGSTYSLAATAVLDLDLDLAGRAYTPSGTRVSGQARAQVTFYFVMWLPNNVMIEDGYAARGSGSGRYVLGPPVDFDSLLSCDLHVRNAHMAGAWSRLQRRPMALKVRLVKTLQLGSLTFRRVYPVVDEEIPALDEYLFDRRFLPIATPIRFP